MNVKTTHPVDVVINGKIKTLKPGEHELPESAAYKLLKTGAARECKLVSTASKPTKASKVVSNEA